jgi:aryl-alcohol dehydrogenase-like predicted oxidoreductase
MDSLHILVEQGKVLYLGISDTPAFIVAAANTYAKAHGKTPFSIYQGRWSVMLRDMEREIIPMCRHFGMAIAPWDALGGGKFQSKKALEERKKNNEGLRSMMGGEQTEQEQKISEALEKVAGEHGIESITAIALAYVMAKAPYVFPIVGGRKVEHLHDNIQALKIKLTDKQIEHLESVVPFEAGFPNNFVGVVSQTLAKFLVFVTLLMLLLQNPAVSGKSPTIVAGTASMSWVTGPHPIDHE